MRCIFNNPDRGVECGYHAKYHQAKLASGIQGLEDQKQGVGVVRVKNILLARQLSNIQPKFYQTLLFSFEIPAATLLTVAAGEI